jgi:transposase
VRLYRQSDPKPVIAQLARQLGVHPEALRSWIRQDEADRGERHDRPTTDMVEENRRLRAENKELRAVNEVLKAGAPISPMRSARPGEGHEFL